MVARTVAPGARCAAIARLLAIGRGEVTRALMGRAASEAPRSRGCSASDRTAEAIRALDEHWDGRGQPRGLERRRDPPAGAHPVPGPDRRGLPRDAGVPAPTTWPAAPRPLVRPRAGRARSRLPRRRLLGVARRPDCALGAGGPRDRGRRGRIDRDRRGLRRDRRRQVAVDVPAFGRRAWWRPASATALGLRRRSRPTCAAPRCCTTSASWRLQPDPGQAGPADRRRVRARARAPAVHARVLDRVPCFRDLFAGRRRRTTSASTAGATPGACGADQLSCRCGCSRWRTSPRRSPPTGRTATALPRRPTRSTSSAWTCPTRFDGEAFEALEAVLERQAAR